MRNIAILLISALVTISTGMMASAKPLSEEAKKSIILLGKKNPNDTTELVDDKWIILSKKSKLDESYDITLSLECETDDDGILVIQCLGGKTEIAFSTGEDMGECQSSVEYKIDDSKIQKMLLEFMKTFLLHNNQKRFHLSESFLIKKCL